MAHLGGLHLPSLQSRSHDISSICPSQKWSSSGGKVTGGAVVVQLRALLLGGEGELGGLDYLVSNGIISGFGFPSSSKSLCVQNRTKF